LQLDPGSLWFAHACPIGEHSGTPEGDVARSSRRVTHGCGTPSPAPTGPSSPARDGGVLSRVGATTIGGRCDAGRRSRLVGLGMRCVTKLGRRRATHPLATRLCAAQKRETNRMRRISPRLGRRSRRNGLFKRPVQARPPR
jgi:hypothetical protein